jgi:cytochrome P450
LITGEKWRTHRRIGNQVLGPPAVKEIQPLVGKAVRQLLTQLLEKPNDFLHHARYMTGDIIMKMIYGIEVLPAEDPYIMAAQDILEKMTVASIPGTYWVDFMPILKYIPDWLPGASFKRRAKEWKAAVSKTVDTPFQVAKNSIANGTNLPSLTSSNLADIDYSEKNALQEEEDLKNVAGTLYVVGADSTTSSMSTFFLAMMTNPEAQAQAQAELDRVLGPGKLPTMEDEVLLPFVTAVVKEVLRWKTVSPIGNPHALEADDIYQGYKLSAGTIVVTNIWAMLHDKELYPEPYTFNPERFIKNGHWNPSVVDPTDITFGFGRRICSGKYLAYSTLWISIASVLTMFNITKAMDEDGHTIEPSGEYTSGTFCKPVPFKCCIKPRSKRHAQECQ